ncbi:DEAD/DEAH box helicase [Campylobacter upsaliensis]|uniref:EcoAI/FtnUII family type I restriction enzme subunit R n=1 Tax=Campylobacter upsaliensis TaxID=28080 RepID=UPI00107ACD48|nr:DEAD/DEAH box helicase family protein [Campylobacter upsaliensis]EAB5282170.1 DEAD/DEAH box helicase [Campylobacter upsaliensis]EAH4719422.1 DEAD/DEAH box helicase [Campylobacter upsaliensis]EAI0665303.1 DEAD/DEAH box helicase [Campylobacter upsaliensis]EAJ1741079.1 DEAD/DEAH box helicase [Campylobacter upsaliensis]EAJ7264669.1 DEAD/DEAH box helicase [Campylobacter upsaliensis]
MKALQNLSEEDTKKRYIEPALEESGWDFRQIRLEYGIEARDYEFSDGEMTKSGIRKAKKKADYALFYNNTCLAVIEAKAYNYNDSEGLEQAKDYAKALQVPFAFASSGKGFVKFSWNKDFIGSSGTEPLPINAFPSPQELYQAYKKWESLESDYLLTTKFDNSDIKHPLRYYQRIAVTKTLIAAQKGQMRILLVLATGTGKTLIAYQIAHRLFNQTLPNGKKIQKILYLADRNELINADTQGKFKSFRNDMYKIRNHNFSQEHYKLYFGIYQQFISGSEKNKDKVEHYKNLKPDFFDLIFIDECHRGSARADSTWREILEYFSPALQIGMTATPKFHKEQRKSQEAGELEARSEEDNIDYFGEPVYQYSLKQGIEDGYLAPFSVIEMLSNYAKDGYEPQDGEKDLEGKEIKTPERKTEEAKRFEGKIAPYEMNRYCGDTTYYIKRQIHYVAEQTSFFLNDTLKNPYAKTIIFCNDQTHADFMKLALIDCNPEPINRNANYIARITSNDEVGKRLLDSFKSAENVCPIIVTTSDLLSTGVDTQMVQVIAIDKFVNDKSLFKQMIGRGTRLNKALEARGKTQFYILDFNGTARKFLTDPDFDGAIEFIGKDEIKPPKPREKKPPKSRTIIKHTLEGEAEIHTHTHTVSLWREVDGKMTLITDKIEVFCGTRLKDKNKLNDYLLALRDTEDLGENKARTEFLNQLEENGIFIHELKALEQFQNCDEFDILLSLAKGGPALSRTQRAKKANRFLAELEPKARELMEFLLQQYEKNGFNELKFSNFTNEPIATKYTRAKVKSILDSSGGFKTLLAALKNELYKEVG